MAGKKLLVLGASGMLGHVIALYLRESGYNVDTVANSRSFDDQTIRMDLMAKESFERFLEQSTYDYILNAAGILVQTSTEHKDTASYINGYLPHQLEYFYKNRQTKIIHYSTDCVFSGKNGPYTEESFMDGDLFYDKSKALGEIINDKDLTLRQSIIGPDLTSEGTGLFNWFMAQHDEVKGFSSAIWTGVTTIELAKATKDAIEQGLTGLYHFVSPQSISKYELLKLFNDEFDRGIRVQNDTRSMNIDRTLINTRTDFTHTVPEYSVMIAEMKSWIQDHKNLYSHYS
jgi:dTDP-4-dehydrorhamnose reductase